MKLYIMRHGETDANRSKRLQGRMDNPLNENGVKLAREVGEALKDIRFSLWITSPLKRAAQTGELVLAENRASSGIKCEKDERIIEISFGVWEGLGCGKENFEIPCDDFSMFYKNPDLLEMPEGAETAAEVKRRTLEFLRSTAARPELKDREGEPEKNILVTTHGFAMRAMLNSLYEDPADFWQGNVPPNCAVNIVEADNAGNLRLTARDVIYYDPGEVRNFYK